MSTIQYDKCPLCNSGHFYEYLTTIDYSVSKEEYTINQCETCHLLFTDNIPDINNIGPYYKSENYISHTNQANNFINRIYKIVRNHTLTQKVRLIQNYSQGSILDIGCGTGLFLEQALKRNYEITGVETDSTARSNQSQVVANQCVNSIQLISEGKKFNAITMWHVLEHVHDLTNQFDHVAQKLTSNGHIFIAVPNPNSWDATHYGKYWAAWDVPRHLYHFRKKQVQKLFSDNNIELIETRPLYFDSFYVSMLSEKYKNNNIIIQLVNGFLKGLFSNFKGINHNNFSSLIYIGRKNEN